MIQVPTKGPLNLHINVRSWMIHSTVNLDQNTCKLLHIMYITLHKTPWTHPTQNFSYFGIFFSKLISSNDLNLNTYFTFFLLIYSNTNVSWNREFNVLFLAVPYHKRCDHNLSLFHIVYFLDILGSLFHQDWCELLWWLERAHE